MSHLEAALNYAKHGIPVFLVHGINEKGTCTCKNPNCTHQGKHQILTGGHKNATCDQQQIISWWHQHPQANIGVPTGKASGWYVVDIDKNKHGIENYSRFVEQHKPDIPEATLKAHTGGGGFHLFYGQPANGQAVGSGTHIGRLEGSIFAVMVATLKCRRVSTTAKNATSGTIIFHLTIITTRLDCRIFPLLLLI